MKTLLLQNFAKTPRHFVSSATFAVPLFTAIVEEIKVLKTLVRKIRCHYLKGDALQQRTNKPIITSTIITLMLTV